MKTSTRAAIQKITAQMTKTADRDGYYERRVQNLEAEGLTRSDAQAAVDAELATVATELFDDCAEATRDMILAGINGLNYAATAYTELGFGSVVAAQLARATLVFLDDHDRASQSYIDGLAEALKNSSK